MIGFEKVYDLKNQDEYIKQVQEATLNTSNFGMQNTHGLFGSSEWWSNIESGQLECIEERGVIKDLYMGSMGDWPIVVVDNNGVLNEWTREAETDYQYSLYEKGKTIIVKYVIQLFKETSEIKKISDSLEDKVILEMWVEQSNKPSQSDS
ncbi:hypothetical protein VST7929_02933 [Vibrio stylophorae]|uniref:Uncharacterized protein n=1 Tax=Vibrio stylophorae TaxID=659351 RepID=A0ABN8DY90_9VIBR|nr:hypothetical protein [Vibrio stylophorae]CAH0535336.1 hypothetical protein VST7929_02933 [Vibrio stylophorae]